MFSNSTWLDAFNNHKVIEAYLVRRTATLEETTGELPFWKVHKVQPFWRSEESYMAPQVFFHFCSGAKMVNTLHTVSLYFTVSARTQTVTQKRRPWSRCWKWFGQSSHHHTSASNMCKYIYYSGRRPCVIQRLTRLRLIDPLPPTPISCSLSYYYY